MLEGTQADSVNLDSSLSITLLAIFWFLRKKFLIYKEKYCKKLGIAIHGQRELASIEVRYFGNGFKIR